MQYMTPAKQFLFSMIVALVLTPLHLNAQTRPAQPTFPEGDPALVRILVWQLDASHAADAEQLLRANMATIKDRLEDVVKDIDKEFDILGRFGAVSIRFGPGYGELE